MHQAPLIALLVLPVLMVTSAAINFGELPSSDLESLGSKPSFIPGSPLPGGPKKAKEFMGFDWFKSGGDILGGVIDFAKHFKPEEMIAKSVESIKQAGKVLSTATKLAASLNNKSNTDEDILAGFQTVFDAPAQAVMPPIGDNMIITNDGSISTGDVVLDVLNKVTSVSKETLDIIDTFNNDLCTLVNVLFFNGKGTLCAGLIKPAASGGATTRNDGEAADSSSVSTEASTTQEEPSSVSTELSTSEEV